MNNILMKVKSVIAAAILMILVGCDNPPEYQVALYNYSKDMCEGKLMSVSTWHVSHESGYTCITVSGVEFRKVKMGQIPVKYWEIPDDPEK